MICLKFECTGNFGHYYKFRRFPKAYIQPNTTEIVISTNKIVNNFLIQVLLTYFNKKIHPMLVTTLKTNIPNTQ